MKQIVIGIFPSTFQNITLQKHLSIYDATMNYTLKISTRAKRISLRVIDGEVCVTAPKRHSKRLVETFIHENQAWIEKQKRKQAGIDKHIQKQRYEAGGQFRYLGDWVTIVLDDVDDVSLDGKTLTLPKATDLQKAIHLWMIEQAQVLLTQKVHCLAEKLGVQVKRIQLGKFKSKWGSAHTDGTLKFSWPIIQAPEKIIDYLVIHEVAHLIEMNHSHKFWAIVESLCPTYKERKKWLKEQSQKLSIL